MTAPPYRDFIAAQAQLKGPPVAEHLSALELLFDDSQTPVSEVAEKIKQPYFKAIQEGDPAQRQYARVWRTVSNAVKQLTDYNDKLADLVYEIFQIPDPDLAAACSQDFNEEWREFAWNFAQPLSTDPDRAAKCQAWVNMNNFCAKLSARGDPRVDRTCDADTVIRHTLEQTPWEIYHHPDIEEKEDLFEDEYPEWRDAELEKREIRSLNYWVPGAAAWFKIHAGGIYRLEGPMAHDRPGKTTNWKGPSGWSKERFAYWIERFEWIATVTALEKETKLLAKDAAEIMEKVVEEDKKCL
ncbi:hypothetical protein BX600DRAFT_52951 [Xylariales sp. PMI_506]|nr:hypothetical protein BX600DRAFT_52951 [Xylariales sp. PMI_506]